MNTYKLYIYIPIGGFLDKMNMFIYTVIDLMFMLGMFRHKRTFREGEKIMAGTRTAPTVGGSPNKVLITISVIDASGDKYADTLVLQSVPLDIDIEAYVAGYQLVTQASVYNVAVSSNYFGDADPDNAETDQRNSVKDGINFLWKDFTTLNTQGSRVVAPIPEVMQGNQDIPLLTYADMLTYIAEAGDILTDYALQSAQYTERRERNNERIKA